MILSRFMPKELTVPLPRVFNRGTMYAFIDQVLDTELNARCQKITFDFSTLHFIYPVGVTALSNLIEYLLKRKVRVLFTNHSLLTQCNRFLDDSGFFQLYTKQMAFPHSNLRSTTLPLARVRHDQSHSWIENSFTNWISTRVGFSASTFASITVCLKEVFNNIDDHSGEKVGCVFAQHYPKMNEIQVAISDFGIGIPANVKRIRPELTDSGAIKAALVEGFTTKSTSRNQGAGLDILTKYVVLRNRGSIIVHSLKGSFSCTYQDGITKQTPREEHGYYPGTLLQITFRTNYLEAIAEKEDFEW